MTDRKRYQYILTLCVDAVALICATLLSRVIFGFGLHLIPEYFSERDYLFFYFILALAFLVSYACLDKQEDLLSRLLLDEIFRSLRLTLLWGSVAALLLLLAKLPLNDSRYFFLGGMLFNLVLNPVFYTGIKKYLKFSSQRNKGVKLVGVLTVADRASPLLQSIREDWTKKLCGVALLDAMPGEVGTRIDGVLVTASFSDHMAWLRRAALDEVYVDVPYDRGEFLFDCLLELESMGLNVHFSAPLLEKLCGGQSTWQWPTNLTCNLERWGSAYMIGLSTVRHSIRDRMIKRFMDICGALVGLIISIPIIAIVAVPLKLESPGPLFFKQKRIGLNGRCFYIYKLRSMYVDAEERKKELLAKNEMNGLMFKLSDDPRITRVGSFIRKTSIDELPQFYNVLRGDMSLVGTRPPTVDEYTRYESHHKRRLSMKPGITGLWQVSGRSNIDNFEDVVRLDTQYIDSWSLRLDIKILLKTVGVVLWRRGAK